MALDPRIALGVENNQIFNPAAAQLQQQNLALNQAKVNQIPLQTQQMQQQTQSGQLQAAMQKVDALGQLVNGVNDEQSWQNAKQQAKQMGIDTSKYDNVPYDPQLINQIKMQTLSVKERLTLQAQNPLMDFGNQSSSNLAQSGMPSPPNATTIPAASSPADSNTIAAPANRNVNEDALKTYPPQIASQVKALAEGRMTFPSGFALKSPYWQQMLGAVSAYDPSFDAVNYNARSKTRGDFTSGKSAQSINALNTVIGHLQTLSDAADNLNNSNLPAWNAVANFASNAAGKPQVKNFDVTKKAVVDELTRVYRGSGGSESDIKTWSDAINSSNSPEQLHSVIGQIGDLLESKVNALGEQYNQGMGTTDSSIRLVTPHADAALQKIRGGSSGQTSVSADPAKIKAAKDAGYSDQEIQQYLQGETQ